MLDRGDTGTPSQRFAQSESIVPKDNSAAMPFRRPLRNPMGQYIGYLTGCVARAGVVLRPPPVATPGIGAPGVGVRPGTPMNRGGPVNRAGRR
jgi:hypothetical protein